MGLLNGIEKKAYGWKQFKRWEWYWEPRVDQNGLFPNSDINFTEWQNYLDTHSEVLNNSSSSTTSNWTYSGSNSSTGGYAGVGRLNCIAFHPTNANIFWVGSPAGGCCLGFSAELWSPTSMSSWVLWLPCRRVLFGFCLLTVASSALVALPVVSC